MKVAIVYDSLKGTTAAAARAMGRMMEEEGHECQVQTISEAYTADFADVDLLCVGSWVKGLFIIMQHPTEGTMGFIERLGSLEGKKAAVFCTYKVATGSTLRKMAQALEDKGATVVGQFKYRGPESDSKFVSFVRTLT